MGVKYNIYETHDFFEHEVKQLRETLKNEVNAGKMEPEDARKKYDMYLSVLSFLRICVNMAEHESYLGDNTFSFMHLYADKEEASKGNKKLKDAVKNL